MEQEYYNDGYSIFDSERQMNETAQRIAKVVGDRILADINRPDV
jgi:hypothetical protein